MFYHNFKYSLKTLFKSKDLLFWTFIFPLILGTFFKLAFSNIEKSETFDVINIAIVDSSNYQDNKIYQEVFETLSDKNNENQVFNLEVTNLKEANSLLEEKEIIGYLEFLADDIKITVKENGIDETILRYVVSEIQSRQALIETLVKEEIKQDSSLINYEKIYSKIDALMNEEVTLKDISKNNLSYTMIEYYTLIAMAALYGGIIALTIMNAKLPNMQAVGKRTAVAPIKKGEMIVSSLLASYLIQLMGLVILFIYTILVLKVDYGTHFILVIVLALVGSLAGLTTGVGVATLLKTNENAKIGILIALTMLECFLSGMMGITMKYIIDKNIPILNLINPANMITDGLYSLYYYDTFNRFYFNIFSLLIYSLVIIGLSVIKLRRQKYDSL